MPHRIRSLDPTPEPTGVLPTLVRAYVAATAGFEKQTGIHIARWRILDVLHRHGEMPQHGLTRLTLIDPAAISRILRDFVEFGDVARRHDPADHRQSLVSLTPKGVQKTLQIAAARERFVAAAIDGIDPADLEKVETTLQALRANLARLA